MTAIVAVRWIPGVVLGADDEEDAAEGVAEAGGAFADAEGHGLTMSRVGAGVDSVLFRPFKAWFSFGVIPQGAALG